MAAKLGHIVTAETRAKIGIANKGKVQWKAILASAEANRGKKWSAERRAKHREAMKGVVNAGQFKSENMRGEKHPMWKGGLTPENAKWRQTKEYRQWREAVGNRDKWECIECGAKAQLQADHIKPYILYPELRYDISNGRILCIYCHKKTDSYAGKARKLILMKSNGGL